MDEDVVLSVLFLFDIRRFDFERRSDDGKLYKNVPIKLKIRFHIECYLSIGQRLDLSHVTPFRLHFSMFISLRVLFINEILSVAFNRKYCSIILAKYEYDDFNYGQKGSVVSASLYQFLNFFTLSNILF